MLLSNVASFWTSDKCLLFGKVFCNPAPLRPRVLLNLVLVPVNDIYFGALHQVLSRLNAASSPSDSEIVEMSDPKYITTPKPELVERIRADQYLDEAHQATFNTAVMNILSTKIAESTFAQIIDGFPLKDVAFGKTGHRNTIYDPIFKHTALCRGSMDKASQFRASVTPKEMEMEVEVSISTFSDRQLGWAFTENRDAQALHRFQSVPADSRASHLPLIELSARAVHRIAVLLFQLDDTYHKNESHVGERPESDTRPPPFPTPFTLSSYRFQEQYPDGVADLAGYWAEDEIFGGVVLFERVNTKEEVCKFHGILLQFASQLVHVALSFC